MVAVNRHVTAEYLSITIRQLIRRHMIRSIYLISGDIAPGTPFATELTELLEEALGERFGSDDAGCQRGENGCGDVDCARCEARS